MKVNFLSLKEQYELLLPEIRNEIDDIFLNTAFIGGSKVKEFEENVAQYLGVKHAIGCGSGTDALMLALRACNVNPGDEVITTPFSFFATSEAIAAVGAKPVFVEVRSDDYNIDPQKIEEAITEKTKVILPVHIFGAPCEMKAIVDIAKKYNLKVVEDCAQAIGSSFEGTMAGALGDVGCFSFYPTKNLGAAGDGGMVTTNCDELATVLSALKEHGAGKNGAKSIEYLYGIKDNAETKEMITELYDPYKYYNYLIGYNSRLDAIQAAVLKIKLSHLNEYNSRRAEIANKYLDGLTDEVKKPRYADNIKPCWHQFVVRTKDKQELSAYLAENGVGCGTFYPVPLHKQKAFNTPYCQLDTVKLPIAEKLSSETVCLPIYPELTDEEVDFVIKTVNAFFNKKK